MPKTGATHKIKISTSTHIGGILESGQPETRPNIVTEKGSGQHKLALLQIASIGPRLRFKLKLQRLMPLIADYDHTYKRCFVSGEEGLQGCDIRWTDGLDSLTFANLMVNSCSINIPTAGAITADIDGVAYIAPVAEAYGSDPTPNTEETLTKANLKVLTLDSFSMLNHFTDLTIVVNNNVKQVPIGNNLAFAVRQEEVLYEVRIVRGLKTQSFKADAKTGTKRDFIFQIDDNQSPSPRKTQFTFANMAIGDRTEAEGLGMTLEHLRLVGDSLILSQGS